MANIFEGTKSYKSTVQNYRDRGQETEIAPISGFFDRMGAAFDYQANIETEFGQRTFDFKKAQSQLDLHIKHNTGILDRRDRTLFSQPFQRNTYEESVLNVIKARDAEIKALKEKFPDAGFKTAAEIDQEILQEQAEIIKRDEQSARTATGMDELGGFLGYMAGYVADPINAASLTAGAIPKIGASAAMNFLRVGSSEAAIESLIQLKDKPGAIDIREKVSGEDIPTSQAVAESAVAVAGAGILGGAIGAIIGKFAGRSGLDNPVTANTVDKAHRARQAVNQGVEATTEQLDHLNMLEEAVSISESTPRALSQAKHAENYVEARESIARGDDVNLEGAAADASELSQAKADSGATLEEPVEFVQHQQNVIEAAESRLQEEDVTFDITDADGNVTERISLKQEFNRIKKDEKAVTELEKCLLGGANAAE